MLRITLFFILLSVAYESRAQETIVVTDKIGRDMSAKYHVLKSNPAVKQGLYQALYKKKTVVALGNYEQDKQTGIWHFYDPAGKIVQRYNYSTQKLTYLAPDDTASYTIQYAFDNKLTDTDHITKPIRVGGVFYGYLPYLKSFKIEQTGLAPQSLYGVLQLLISPIGRLAECKLMIKTKLRDHVIDRYQLNGELLKDDDRLFIPATINGENVSSTIYILCKISSNWNVSIY